MDNRDKKLAKQLVEYSTNVKAGETVYIEVKGFEALNLCREIISKSNRSWSYSFLVF